jgi:hypothetical protein
MDFSESSDADSHIYWTAHLAVISMYYIIDIMTCFTVTGNSLAPDEWKTFSVELMQMRELCEEPKHRLMCSCIGSRLAAAYTSECSPF